MWKPSKNPKVEEITKSCKNRSTNLDRLKAIKIELPNHLTERRCAWCAEGVLTHGNQKYCSNDCSTSAMAWAYPQKEDALKFLLVRQNWKCNICQFDYRPDMVSILQKDRFLIEPKIVTDEDLQGAFWYYMKRLKSRVNKAYKPEVDHIVPVYKGGTTLGLDNHQAICYTCHKVKSKVDNSGPRSKKPKKVKTQC